jgi:hypothetical protein
MGGTPFKLEAFCHFKIGRYLNKIWLVPESGTFAGRWLNLAYFMGFMLIRLIYLPTAQLFGLSARFSLV